MKAEVKTWGQDDRKLLKDILPINTPLSIGVGPSSFCNLKCSYCAAHGVAATKLNKSLLKYDDFCKAIDSLSKFQSQISAISFSDNGEPLINKDIANMVRYAKEVGKIQSAKIFTNGILLTNQVSEALIDAGLDVLRLSIQGVSSEQYFSLCGVKINYDKLLENIEYFYNYRNKVNSKCIIFVKTFDQSLKTKEDEDKYYSDFGNICDQISLETIIPVSTEEYDLPEKITTDTNIMKQKVEKSNVCPQPFYTMYIRSNGNVTPCCAADPEFSPDLLLGNVANDSLYDMWNSDKLKSIYKCQLKLESYKLPTCKTCLSTTYTIQEVDRIDDSAKRIYKEIFNEDYTL